MSQSYDHPEGYLPNKASAPSSVIGLEDGALKVCGISPVLGGYLQCLHHRLPIDHQTNEIGSGGQGLLPQVDAVCSGCH